MLVSPRCPLLDGALDLAGRLCGVLVTGWKLAVLFSADDDDWFVDDPLISA